MRDQDFEVGPVRKMLLEPSFNFFFRIEIIKLSWDNGAVLRVEPEPSKEFSQVKDRFKNL